MPFYFGDLHNHCGISYGHGSLEEAYKNARLQLDFASVTGHSSWPDMPAESRLQAVIDYHQAGFSRLAENWDTYLDVTEACNAPGAFVTFFSYEWHSREYGDYVAYFKGPVDMMEKPRTLKEFRQRLLHYRSQGTECLLIPHHIGYKTGFRGINWDTFCEDISPVVEIVSMHGCAECDDTPIPYLHTMGPLTAANTMQAGLADGRHFGVIGSTDHHSGHPGSYGYGRTGVWAEALTRDAIWEAIRQRRTYALTGDKIELTLTINGFPMGARIPDEAERRITLNVRGGYALQAVELLKNNRVLFQQNFVNPVPQSKAMKGKLVIEVGWGEKGLEQAWEGEINIEGGTLLHVEPRLHGIDVVDPQDRHQHAYQFSHWERTGRNAVAFRTGTWGNPTTITHANQAICLEVDGNPLTTIACKINDTSYTYTLKELLAGSKVEYLAGFLTGAIRWHRFIPEEEYSWNAELTDRAETEHDCYYVRVSQKNGQWAWSSPIRFVNKGGLALCNLKRTDSRF